MTVTMPTSPLVEGGAVDDGLRLAKWPTDPWVRRGLRLALAVPYIVVVFVAEARGIESVDNERIEQASRAIRWGTDDLDFVSDLYPPLPIAIASILPGGAVWVGVAGALFAGFVLQALAQRLHQRRIPPWLTVLLVASVGLQPGVIFIVTQSYGAFLGTGMIAVAIAGMVRFAVDRDTEGGFQCGLAAGIAVLCDPAMTVLVVAIGVGALLIAFDRYRAERGASVATVLVITFPAVAALAAWTFLAWQFTGDATWLENAEPQFLDFPGGVLDTMGREASYVLVRYLLHPVTILAGILLWRSLPVGAMSQLLTLASLCAMATLFGGGVGRTSLLIGVTGVMAVLPSPARIQRVLAVAAIAQIALNWFPIRTDSEVERFVSAIF